MLSHPFGLCEIEEGTFNETSLTLETKQIIRTSTAKEPYTTRLIRNFNLVDGKLNYHIQMATSRQELYDHLEAVLERQE